MTSAEGREIRYQRRKAKREEARRKRSMASVSYTHLDVYKRQKSRGLVTRGLFL